MSTGTYDNNTGGTEKQANEEIRCVIFTGLFELQLTNQIQNLNLANAKWLTLGKANGAPPVSLVLVGSIPTPKFFNDTKNFEGGSWPQVRSVLIWRGN
ncbi:hypothetical protein RGU12_08530 [Fredinandcohnia sp. QZ13]|uniref:hypothetical protein n=1 Tax=Fredinandcohnia sp. QZ13 TaxID=3073144 RepID=UPI00285356A2|nr:hypothetical protein [Fredinandcohnia sp. QZ13]MDR4887589.1 hypothetical protein [Fredinandcohnia sp. QZ13]